MTIDTQKSCLQPTPKSIRGRDLVSPRKLFELRGYPSVQTSATWRFLGKGPKYYKIGRNIFYSLSEFDAWVDAQIVDPSEF